ncbi:MAG TPA: signal peptidase I [Acidimicrobiia bacterium]
MSAADATLVNAAGLDGEQRGRRPRLLMGVGRLSVGAFVLLSVAVLLFVGFGAATSSWRVVPVRTGSMSPDVPQGAAVLVHAIPTSEVTQGDVIVFQAPIPGRPLVVHRVFAIEHGPRGSVVTTKGDANAGPDPWHFRIRGATAWRVGFVMPTVGKLVMTLGAPDARVATLAIVVAIVVALGLAAIWTWGALAPILWRAPEPVRHAIQWSAPEAHSWRGPGARPAPVPRDLVPITVPVKGPSRPRSLIRTATAIGLVGAISTAGFGALALFTGTTAATATYSSSSLEAPTGLGASVSGTTVTLTWTATTSTWATGTRVMRGTVSGGPYSEVTRISGLGTTTYNDTPGAGTFSYVVESYYSGNSATWTSADSNEASATVNPALPVATTAWDMRDASVGSELDKTDVFYAAGDSRSTAALAWGTAFDTTKYLQWDFSSALPSGLSASSVAFNFRFAANRSSETACFYFETRRASTGAVVATHGSSSAPAGCVTGTTQQTISTSLSEINTSALANDVRIRLYGKESGARSALLDMATVSGTTAAGTGAAQNFTLYEVRYTDNGAGLVNPTSSPWTIALADGTIYQTSIWSSSFASTRYLKFTFPSYAPNGTAVSAASFTMSYLGNNSSNACYYFEVLQGSTVIGTHGSTSSPVSCNATASLVSVTTPLPEVDTAAEANGVAIKVYMKNASSVQTSHDLIRLDYSYQ